MQVLIKFAISILVAVIQISFISALPNPFYNINIIILILAVYLILNNIEEIMPWTILFGFLLDLHSFYFFGLNIISLILALLIADLFLRQFFTNRSIYSFVFIASIALFCFEALKFIFISLADFFIQNEIYKSIVFYPNLILSLLYKLLFIIILSALAFYFINYFSKKMKSFFIAVKK